MPRSSPPPHAAGTPRHTPSRAPRRVGWTGIRATVAAAALASSVASARAGAQSVAPATHTYAGCTTFLCATFTLVLGTPYAAFGATFTPVSGRGTIILQPAVVAAGYTEVFAPQLTGPVFGSMDTQDLGFLPDLTFGGRPAGAVITYALGSADTSVLFGPGGRYDLRGWLDNGAAVGRTPPVQLDVVLTETPEPAPFALTLGALLALGGVAARRPAARARGRLA